MDLKDGVCGTETERLQKKVKDMEFLRRRSDELTKQKRGNKGRAEVFLINYYRDHRS